MNKKLCLLVLLGALMFSLSLTAQAVEFVIQYDDGSTVYYSGGPQPNDTCGVWFEPPTDCQVISGLFQFNNNMGGDAEVYVWDIVDGFNPDNYYDRDETGASPGPTPLGAAMAGPIPYSFDNSGDWQEVVFADYGWTPEDLDVGMNNFYIGYVLAGTGAQPYYPSILGDAGDDRPYHSLTYLTNPGGSYPGMSGWWAYGIDWMLRAKVNLYGDPPPTVADVMDPPDTYAAGPYTISATVTDMDTTGLPGSGTVTEARLIYSIDGGSEVTVIMTNTGGDTYEGDIEAFAVGSMANFRVEADDDQGHTSVAPSVAGYNFAHRQPSEAKILLVNDSGDLDGEAIYRDILDNNNFAYDYWFISTGDAADMGYPGSDVINTTNYSTIIWFNGTAYSGNLPDNDADLSVDPVANYMDDGGNFFLSSSDYLGGAFNPDDWDDFTAIPGTFMYDYLKVDFGWSDSHMGASGESDDTLHFGAAGDPIGGDFTAGVYSHPDPNYNDYAWPNDGQTCFFTEIEDQSAGNWYDGAFKMVFLPWVLEACDDPADAEGILLNVLTYFNENPGPEITMLSGSRYGIYGSTPYGVVAEIMDPDGFGSATVKYRWDGGDWQTGNMVIMIGDQYLYNWSPPASWSTLEYYVYAMDASNSVNYGPTYECWYTGEYYTPGATLLYCSDQAYVGVYGAVDYDSTITGPLDNLGVSYDYWDVDENGAMDYWTVLAKYESVFWVGYYDWDETVFPYVSADNPFTMFLQHGKNLLWSSEEMLGTWTNWEDQSFDPGSFAYDWLHVGSVTNDVGYDMVETTGDEMCNGLTSPMQLAGFGSFGSFADYGVPATDVATEGLFFESGSTFNDAPGGFRDDVAQHNVVTLTFCVYMMDEANREAFFSNVLDYWTANPGYSVGVEPEEPAQTPLSYQLEQNYPNPFNPMTQIRFALPENAKVELSIYNVMGQEVAKLLDRDMRAGTHTITWNATQYASGVYFYKLKTANFESARKMILVK